MNELVFELIKAIGKAFLNPILYWLAFISFMISMKRIKQERKNFGHELFPHFAELQGSIHITIFSTIFLSLILLMLNAVFVREFIFFLSIIIFILSFIFGFRALSAAYTLGLTFLLFKLLEHFDNTLFDSGLFTDHTFAAIAILISLLLLVEAYMFSKIKNKTSFPEVVKSRRGSWIGIYHLQKASFVPFFTLLPSSVTSSTTSAGQAIDFLSIDFQFAFVPFFTAFHYITSGQLPEEAAEKLKLHQTFLAIIVFALSTISFYLPGIAIFAVLTAMFGKWLIDYQLLKDDRKKGYLFLQLKDPLKVLAVVPGSPAEKLGFKPGDLIIKTNGKPVHTIESLNKELENILYFPTFEIVTHNHEVVIIENDRYRGNHVELGLIFAAKNEAKSGD